MKKFLITVVALLTATVFQASAMSTARARSEALFLTDKMAYELNLTDAQYEAVYEINFDYFDSLIGTSDILGIYWTRRANELGYVLSSWQYRLFLESEYFYRPVTYRNNVWYFSIYDRYAHNRFYRSAPVAFVHYRGHRTYHKDPHNNMHFAQNIPGKPGPAHKPHNNKPAVKPNNGGNHNGNVGKPNNGGNHNGNVKPNNGGNHNGNLGKPNKPANGGGNKPANVDKPNKPANGGNHNGNAMKAPTTSKPEGNMNSGARRASTNAPARTTSSNVRANPGNGGNARHAANTSSARRR